MSNHPEERKTIVKIGQTMARRGLLVRAFGSVGILTDDTLLITPRGIPMDSLKAEDIVAVDRTTLSPLDEGTPADSFPLHLAVAKELPDVRVIMHTHQVYASCAGTLGLTSISLPYDTLPITVPVAPYAAPGSPALSAVISEAIAANPSCPGVIMGGHGLVTFGRTPKEALTRAEQIEILCYNYLIDVCHTDLNYGIEEGFSSVRENGEIRFILPDTPDHIRSVHEKIYKKRTDVSFILHTCSEAEMIVARRCTEIRPLFTDFAAVIGTDVKIPSNETGRGGTALSIRRGVNAVFSPEDGAFCLGKNEEEANCAALILNKGCIAEIAALRTGGAAYLDAKECRRLNRRYRSH